MLPAAQIANLPTGRVLLIRRGIAPVIGRVQMAWRRRDVRHHAFTIAHPAAAARLARTRAASTVPVRTARRVLARVRPSAAPRGVPIDLDPPTVEVPVPVGAPHTRGHGHGAGHPTSNGHDNSDAERAGVPFGNRWWN